MHRCNRAPVRAQIASPLIGARVCRVAGAIIALVVPTLATFVTISTAAAAATVPAPFKGSIDYYVWGDALSDQIEKTVIEAFNKKHPAINVNLVNSSGNHLDKLLTMILGGSPPDVALVDGYDYASLVVQGQVTDLTQWAQRDRIRGDNVHPAFWKEMVVDGRLYSVANMRGGRIVMYYNQTALDEAGLRSPYEAGGWTWDDLLQTAKQLTKDVNGDARPERWGIQPATWAFWPWVWMNGGDLLDAERTRATLDDPRAYQAIQWLADLNHKHRVVGGNFVNQTVGLEIGWDTLGISSYRKNANFNWDVAMLPTGPAGAITTSKGNELVIPANAKHKELAWEFIKFLGSEEAQYLYGVQGRFFPPHRLAALRLIEEARAKRLAPPHLSILPGLDSRPLPVVPGFTELQRIWGKELSPVFGGQMPAQQAGARIAELSVPILQEARAR